MLFCSPDDFLANKKAAEMHISAALQRVERFLYLMVCAQQQPIHLAEGQIGNNSFL
jgi:hypothetical protein